MKISEFFNKYNGCPVCKRKLNRIIFVYYNHTICYKSEEEVREGIIFRRENYDNVMHIAKSHYDRLHNQYCTEDTCHMLPNTIVVKDTIDLPANKSNISNTMTIWGRASLKLECPFNDFECASTEFYVYDEEQIVYISVESGAPLSNRLVYNDYRENTTTVKFFRGFDIKPQAVTVNLIPFDRWVSGDENKIKERFDKLLVLI